MLSSAKLYFPSFSCPGLEITKLLEAGIFLLDFKRYSFNSSDWGDMELNRVQFEKCQKVSDGEFVRKKERVGSILEKMKLW